MVGIIGWLLAFLLFMGLEVLFRCLVSLWFAAGALAAWLGLLAGLSFRTQLFVFAAVSFLSLFAVRPLAFLWHRGRGQKRRQVQDICYETEASEHP